MKIRANSPCPCGSGKKYEDCHLALRDAPRGTEASAAPVMLREGFLDAAACRALLDCFDRNVARIDTSAKHDYWRDRLLYYQAIAHEPEARAIMRDARARTVEALRAFYGVADTIYTDTVHIVRWSEGQSMPAHADNCEPDGRPNAYPWREYASVLYLNDDYEGGEIYFDRVGLRLKPQAGMLVGFKGGLEHFHGVDKVTRGTRFTMPGWHTRDARRRDRDFDAPR